MYLRYWRILAQPFQLLFKENVHSATQSHRSGRYLGIYYYRSRVPGICLQNLNTVKSYLQNNTNNFTVFTMNVQSLNSTFSEIQSLISDLSKDNLLVDAKCFQETWLHTNDDVGIFHLPAYTIIHKGKLCCGHGGLVIYLNNRYTHTLRSDLYKDSTIWEGLFIDFAGENYKQNHIRKYI